MPRIKAGTSKTAAADRRKLFVQHYIENGRNATQAAISAGYTERSARTRGAELVKDRNILAMIDEVTGKMEAITGLSLERTLRECARLAYSDPRNFYFADGTLKPVSEWTDDMAATVASLEVLEEYEGQGEDRKLVGYTKKLKLWDKNSAIEKAMKHLGAFERDNKQRLPNLAIQVNLVGAKPQEPREVEAKRVL